MKIEFLIVMILLVSLQGNGFSWKPAVRLRPNVVSAELGGAGSYGSLNYERLIYSKKKLMLAGKIGISTYHVLDFTNHFNPDVILPVAIEGCYGRNSKIDLGVGETLGDVVYGDHHHGRREIHSNTFFMIGYRYQSLKNPFVFRFCYTPILGHHGHVKQWAGMSLGCAF